MRKILFAVLLISTSVLFAQSFVPASAIDRAMGGCRLVQRDLFSVHNNPAGMAFSQHTAIGISSERRFLDADLNQLQFVALYKPSSEKWKQNAFGLDVSYFGYSSYQELRMGISYARQLATKFSLGLQLNYSRLAIPEMPAKGFVNADLGLFYQINKYFSCGAQASNLFRWKVDEEGKERVPLMLAIGMQYRPSDKVRLTAELEKDIEKPLNVKSGLEYKPISLLALRIGGQSSPAAPSFGAGLELKKFNLDLSASYRRYLGITPALSLSYRFTKKGTTADPGTK